MHDRFLLAFLTLVLGTSLAIPAAMAHSGVSRSNPADGERLQTAPTEIEMWFTELPTDDNDVSVHLTGPDAECVPTSPPERSRDDPAKLVVRLPTDMPSGPYLVSWSVHAADGDVTRGAIRFRVGDGDRAFPDDCVRTWNVLPRLSQGLPLLLMLPLLIVAALLVRRARLRVRREQET